MSYPNYFNPFNWTAEQEPIFKQAIMDGCVDQTPEIQAGWSDIADKMIELIGLFQVVNPAEATIVQLQADNEADEGKQFFKLRVLQKEIA